MGEQRHRMGLWVELKGVVYALTADKPPPQTQKEQEQGITDVKIQQAKEVRKALDNELNSALTHPYHFETVMGYATHVFEEPPPEATPQDRERAMEEDFEAKQAKMLERAKKERAEREHRTQSQAAQT